MDEFLQISRVVLVGRRMLEFVAPSSRGIVSQMVAEKRVGAYEAEGIAPDGSSCPVQVVGVMATLDGEPAAIADATRLAPLCGCAPQGL